MIFVLRVLIATLLIICDLSGEVFYQPLQGHLHKEDLKEISKKLENLDRGDTVVLELNSSSADLEGLMSFSRELYSYKKQKKLNVIVFIDGQAIGPVALLPFLADQIYTPDFISWGDIPSGSEHPPSTNLLRSQVASFFDADSDPKMIKLAIAMADPLEAKSHPDLGGKEELLVLNLQQLKQLSIPHQILSKKSFRNIYQVDLENPGIFETAPLFEAIKPNKDGSNRFGYIAVDQRDSMISESTWLYVKTALDYYKKNPPIAIILNLNTPGGQVFAAQKIADALHEVDRDFGVPVIAFIDNWAISAGAMLAYSCRYIVAVEDASMGAAAPVFAAGSKMEEAPEKINSALRADMRNRAGFYDRNPDIAAAMVDKDIILVERFGRVIALESEEEIRRGGSNPDKVLSAKGKLLTLTGDELLELGIAETLIVPEKLQAITAEEERTGRYSGKKLQLFHQPFFKEIESPEIDRYKLDWKGKFLSLLTHPAVSSFLVLGMMLGFYMEMSTPSFGLAGSVALVCLALTLLASFALQALGLLELVLIVLGAALIFADLILIPTFGLLGIVGLSLFFLGLFGLLIPGIESISYDVDTATVNAAGDAALERLGWISGGVVASLLGILALARYVTPDLAVLNRFVLKGEQEGYHSGPSRDELPPLGTKGIAATPLRPAGKVLIGETLYDGTSSGRFISKGSEVEVVNLEGSHIVVQHHVLEK